MGTTHVLKSCARAESVRRVVLTSSVAAITDEPDSNHVYTEEDWNEKSSLSRNPYYYSKTLAERAAWDFVKKQKPDFDLVVINPFLVIGPAMTETINTSNHVVLNLLNGSYPGIVNLAWGFVDVRDVARAHILAMETEQAGGRYLCANVTLSMSQVLDIFRQEGFGNYKLPTLALNGKMGNLLMRAGSYFQSKGVASYLRTHIGNVAYFDHSKIKRELGVEFAAIGKTLKDTIEDLIKWSHLPDRR